MFVSFEWCHDVSSLKISSSSIVAIFEGEKSGTSQSVRQLRYEFQNKF